MFLQQIMDVIQGARNQLVLGKNLEMDCSQNQKDWIRIKAASQAQDM